MRLFWCAHERVKYDMIERERESLFLKASHAQKQNVISKNEMVMCACACFINFFSINSSHRIFVWINHFQFIRIEFPFSNFGKKLLTFITCNSFTTIRRQDERMKWAKANTHTYNEVSYRQKVFFLALVSISKRTLIIIIFWWLIYDVMGSMEHFFLSFLYPECMCVCVYYWIISISSSVSKRYNIFALHFRIIMKSDFDIIKFVGSR